MKPPKVTVLMPVYNAGRYLSEAIESILNQSFKDFEFLIINDGSTDNSMKIIERYAKRDTRIRIISQLNKGIVRTLNEGLSRARGDYIARQDADDISTKNRLKLEVEFLDNHPKVGMVGSNYAHIGKGGKRTGFVTNMFTHPSDLKICIVLCNQYGHGSVMIRNEVIDKVGDYDASVGHVEDYDLWIRISRVYQIANIEKTLYLWRNIQEGISNSNYEEQLKQTYKLRDNAFRYFLKRRGEFRLITFHPSGKDYPQRKSRMYRDFAYLYRAQDKWIHSLLMLLLAILFQPFYKPNYRYLLLAVYKPRFDRWDYEFL